MECQRCSSEISDNSRFCNFCGSELTVTITESNTTTNQHKLLQQYLSPELAKRILSVGRQIEGERRHVTILFADITGFTAMSEKLDPEIVSNVLNDCFKGLISIILKYEGTIDKFIGDEIMAIFGAPLAHENDPELAVRSSLEMMKYIERFNTLSPVQLPVPLSLHIGMNSGIVVAGNVGSDLRMNYSVIGNTVNLAARLVDLAPAGEIYLSTDTHKLVTNFVTADGPHPTTIKGKADSVDVFKLISVKGFAETIKSTVEQREFVGREKELRIISQALDQVTQKKAQRILVRGEAGVGKTRLKDELLNLSRSRNISTFEGKCSSFEMHTPYYLWNTLLKSILKVGADTPENETRIRLHDTLQILSLEAHEPYLATLLSLRYEQILLDEDEQRKRKIFESARELLRGYAKRQPTAFILEDLHWIDRFSQELLEFIFAEESAAPALFFLLFRDEYAQSKNLQGRGELIDLNRLSEEEAAMLIRLRFGIDEVPQVVHELVFRRSEGNPFFIEEIIKTLLDKKILAVTLRKVKILSDNIEAGVPETIQGVIMARIDRLEERIKQVLYSASVIGREFSRPILEEVLEKRTEVGIGLRELQSLELILEKEEARELEYLFKHFLIQEVAYNTILLTKRKELHKLIAQSIEKLYNEKIKNFYELLAFHYEKADEWDKAAEYLGRAGRKIGEIFTKDESSGFAERKQAVLVKIHESKSAVRKGWNMTSKILMLYAIPMALISLLGPGMIIYKILNPPPQVWLYNSSVLVKVVWATQACILYIWVGLFLLYWGIIPFFQKRSSTFDLLEDQIRVIFNDASTFTIPFSDIKGFRLYTPEFSKKRPLIYKIIDPFYFEDDLSGNLRQFIKRRFQKGGVPAYAFGFSSQEGGIWLERISGINRLRLILPWLNQPNKSKNISITPANPSEFFDQMSIAFEKWQRHQKKINL